MKLEIGKTYAVSPQWKKSLVEIEMFKHRENNKCVNIETCWRSGTFYIRVEDQDELEELQSCMYVEGEQEEPEVWDYESYGNIEMGDTWDGCSEDWVFYGSGDTEWKDGESEALEEQYQEDMDDDDNDFFGFYDWLEDKDYESLGCNYQIYNGVMIEQAPEEYELEPWE